MFFKEIINTMASFSVDQNYVMGVEKLNMVDIVINIDEII